MKTDAIERPASPLEVIEGGGRPLGARPLSVVAGEELLVGPARVVDVGPSWALVEAAGRAEPLRAELAFSMPYEPSVGDLLVVLGKAGELYAVGVLRGSGRTTLAVPGDLEIQAGGELRLHGRTAVSISGEHVAIEAGRFETAAQRAVEVVGSLVQRVAGLFAQHAQNIHVQADESVVTRGKNATIVTEENVVVNGKQLYLG